MLEVISTTSLVPSHTNDGWVYQVPESEEILAVRDYVIAHKLASHVIDESGLRMTLLRIGSPFSVMRDLKALGVTLSPSQSVEACEELFSQMQQLMYDGEVMTEITGVQITGGTYQFVLAQLKMTDEMREIRRP